MEGKKTKAGKPKFSEGRFFTKSRKCEGFECLEKKFYERVKLTFLLYGAQALA